jgi:hypothetical protein
MDVWVVEMLDDEGDETGAVFHETEQLVNFVRANAQEAVVIIITKTTANAVARLVRDKIDCERAEARR